MNKWGTGTQAGEASPLSIVDLKKDRDEFHRLPESLKRDLCEAQRKRDQEAFWAEKRRKGYLYQSMVEGMVLLFLTEWLFWGLGWWNALVCLGLGAGVGALWQRFALGPGMSALAAMGSFLLVRLLCGGSYPVGAVVSIVVVVCGAMMMRITRQSEGAGM